MLRFSRLESLVWALCAPSSQNSPFLYIWSASGSGLVHILLSISLRIGNKHTAISWSLCCPGFVLSGRRSYQGNYKRRRGHDDVTVARECTSVPSEKTFSSADIEVIIKLLMMGYLKPSVGRKLLASLGPDSIRRNSMFEKSDASGIRR